MSSRQTGYRYGLGGGGGGMISTPSGGYPWQRNDMLSRMLQLQESQQKATSELSAQEATQEKARMQLENELKEHLLNSAQFIDMATKAGATADEYKKYAGDVAKGAVANLLQQQSNINKGLQSPDVQKATHDQLIAEAQAPDVANRAKLKTEAPMGGTAYIPPALGTGMGTTVSGATPGGQSMQQIVIGKDKQGNPIYSPIPAQVTQPYQRGGVSLPIPGQLWNSIGNNSMPATPGGGMATPGMQNDQGNELSTGVNPISTIAGSGQPTPTYVPGVNPQPALGTGVGNNGQQQGSLTGNILKQLLTNAGRTVGNNMLNTGKQNLQTMGNVGSSILPILRMLMNINNPNQLDQNATE